MTGKIQINFRANEEQFEDFKKEYQLYLDKTFKDTPFFEDMSKGVSNTEFMNVAIRFATLFLKDLKGK